MSCYEPGAGARDPFHRELLKALAARFPARPEPCWARPAYRPDRMICMRCGAEGMLLIIPRSEPWTGRSADVVCLAGCPKPWHCTRCEMLGGPDARQAPPTHARWCEQNPEPRRDEVSWLVLLGLLEDGTQSEDSPE